MNLKSFLAAVCVLCVTQVFAQRTITGTVSDKATGETLPGVAVLVEGTSSGVFTDISGKYSIKTNSDDDVLVFSFVGFDTQKIKVGSQSTIDVGMAGGVEIDEVVVTALGVSREKKALGYAVQEVDGGVTDNARETNVLSSMSGKVAGVQVFQSSNIGGSSRMVIRGSGSVTGENQPLFIVNGVPIDNSQYTSADQKRGAGGYDYGTPINDINPDDIESISVLKGPAAAALYGSRASNGAVIITTKSGKSFAKSGRSGIGVEVNSSMSFQNVSVLPDYQNDYGGGAGPNWIDTIGGDFIPDYGYDGSWGPALDGTPVRHWDSWDASDSENFGQTRPWSANPDNVKDFFQTGTTWANSVALVGGDVNNNFRLGYTNHSQEGTQVNSTLDRNMLSFSGFSQLSDRLSADINANYVKSTAVGRPITGYGESVMSQFNQWFQRQLDMERLENYENPDGSQRTWNRNSVTDGSPHYWDNPYWERYKNVTNDTRERMYGVASLNYKINDWMSLTGRAMTDVYTDRREEQVAVGGVRVPKYVEEIRTVKETNFDAILNFNRALSEDLSLNGLVGVNQRLRTYNFNGAETQGGLNTPGFYNLANSASELLTTDELERKKINSAFASVSFGFQSMLYLDLTARNDWSSTLPDANNSYFYPSATASFVFSEVTDFSWMSFGKVRFGWAQVGNDTDPYQTTVSYVVNPNFGSNPNASVPNDLYNPDLLPEKTSGWELGLETNLFNDRVRVDVAYYSQTTEDLIFEVSQSAATGYQKRIMNAGTVENKGIELILGGTPIRTDNFRWDIGINWAKNNNELVELAEGVENLRLTSLFGVSLEARPGESLYTFMGYDFVYDDAGNKLVDADGVYLTTDEVVPIGNTQADWTGGVSNTFSYKGFSLYVLIDMQMGGSLHSYSNQWGKYSGMMAETVENNIREDGIIVEGVYAPGTIIDDVDVSGQANGSVLDAQSHFFLNQGYVVHAADQYDATFVKLREVRLSYTLPESITKNLPVYNIQLSAYGRNLALLHSDVPHIDPEVTVSSSNIQGFEGGQLPIERSIGFNLKFNL
jgi:TonB-linked SusC/RagA family outer membrane protein